MMLRPKQLKIQRPFVAIFGEELCGGNLWLPITIEIHDRNGHSVRSTNFRLQLWYVIRYLKCGYYQKLRKMGVQFHLLTLPKVGLPSALGG